MSVKKKIKVLILGGSGMLGYHCAKVLNEKYHVFITYNEIKIESSNAFSLKIEPDDNKNINELSEIIDIVKPQVIINTIGFVSEEGCEDNYDFAKKLNSDFIIDISNCLKKAKLDNYHFIQISSAGIYGNKNNFSEPWKESDLPNPLSVYTKTKLAGEKNTLLHGEKVTVFRTDFYGINPLSEKSLLWFIIKCAALGKTIDGWQNILFSPVSATKLAQIISEVIDKSIFGLFNVGCNNSCNKYDFAKEVCRLIGIGDNVNKSHLFQDRPIRPNYSVVDSSKLGEFVNLDFTWQNNLFDYMRDLPEFPDKNIFI